MCFGQIDPIWLKIVFFPFYGVPKRSYVTLESTDRMDTWEDVTVSPSTLNQSCVRQISKRHFWKRIHVDLQKQLYKYKVGGE